MTNRGLGAPANRAAVGDPLESAPRSTARAWRAVALAHLLLVLWLLGGALVAGRVLYFRDLSSYYAPNYAFAADSLRHGVWPLWNPTSDAGEPMLLAYPVDLALLVLLGARAPLGVGAALHLLLALAGASHLARRLGMGPWGAWVAGAVYGLGGFVLSTVSLVQLFEAAAWAPWVLAALLAAVRRPDGRRTAILATLVALQASTLGAEIVLQTAAVGLVLVESRALARDRRRLCLVGAGTLALSLALAAPALLGTRALLEGTERARGLPAPQALAFSLHPVVLGEALLPKLLGEPHALSDGDYWGRAFFPDGFPYLLSLYLGAPALLLAVCARGRRRLWWMAALGVLLSLGAYGPLGLAPGAWALPFRGPQKLFFLTHVSIALLSGFGLESALHGARPARRRLVLVVPGISLLLLVVALRADPSAVRDAVARVVPALADSRGLVAARSLWPVAWLPAGALALGVGLVLWRGGEWSRLAGGLVVLDLLIANGGLNPLVSPSFYDLRPDVAALVRPAAADGTYRWFSYGVAYSPGLRFEPLLSRAPSDVWLYYLDRQSLLPRTPALDGLQGAFDVGRTGSEPAGSTLRVDEMTPARFREHHRRLQLANVRWVLSFRPLPPDLTIARGEVKLPEIEPPLALYELRSALPRAFWVPRYRLEPDPERLRERLEDPAFDPSSLVLLPREPDTVPGEDGPTGPVRVAYEALDAHTVRVTASTPPGLLVVLDGYHPDWRAEDRWGPVPIQVAFGRYRAIPTRGGETVVTLRYQPAWRASASFFLSVGGLVALGLALRR
jgi:hypothetical protein